MKFSNSTKAFAAFLRTISLVIPFFSAAQTISAADFSVTTPGGAFAYTINGESPNPTLVLVRGQTYTFAVSSSSIHPFQITGAPPGSLTGNNTSSGTITFTVPTAEVNYGYECSIHHFGGTIITTNAPPPTIQILSLQVSSNLTLLSTGVTNWSVIPEANTNLTTTNWFVLTVQTNRFLSGTNETICGRPPGDSVFVRIRSQPPN